MIVPNSFRFLAILCSTACAFAAPKNFESWAQKPPMGWNSWDPFATTVTETQIRAQTDVMSEKLKSHGWEYIVVDIQWYEPRATGFDYRKDAPLEMDEWGRLIPAVNRFPSSANGVGFKELADYVHSQGLKFGMHLMRGIPRQAVAAKTRIKGTTYTAADIADTSSVCAWNGDMYGVDMAKPGAQEYYDSVLELYASWGLDFIKVDDLSAPTYHKSEVEGIRNAIDHSGRAIVFSTSPGATPVAEGAHVSTHANMWRVSDDFWDNWPELLEQFTRLRNWSPFRGPGHFPDGDMLPLGTIDMGRRTTRFKPDEQFTLMSLWSIVRSPLILGADLTKLDDFTYTLITNDAVLAVNQNSANNHELFFRNGFYGWIADIPNSKDKYLALFNTRALPGEINYSRAVFQSGPVTRKTSGAGVKIDLDVSHAKKLFLVVDDGREGNGGDDIVWSEPTLVTKQGTQKLTDLTWIKASSGRGEVSLEHSATGRELKTDGKTVAFGISAHAKSVIEFDLPPNTGRFQSFAALVDGPPGRGRGPTVRFFVFTQSPYATESAAAIPVEIEELDLGKKIRVFDLWRRDELPPVTREFAPEIPAHGAGLYRISPAK